MKGFAVLGMLALLTGAAAAETGLVDLFAATGRYVYDHRVLVDVRGA